MMKDKEPINYIITQLRQINNDARRACEITFLTAPLHDQIRDTCQWMITNKSAFLNNMAEFYDDVNEKLPILLRGLLNDLLFELNTYKELYIEKKDIFHGYNVYFSEKADKERELMFEM